MGADKIPPNWASVTGVVNITWDALNDPMIGSYMDRIVQLCKTLGNQTSQALSAIPIALMGMKDVLGITDYQIMIYGALLFAPLTVFCRWLPSFAKTRVDLSVKVKGEGQTEEEAEKPPGFRESFAVVKHNRMWMMGTIISLITLVLPGTDGMFLYRFLLPKINFRDREYGGEMLLFIKNTIMGNPGTFLQPFAGKFIKLMGGELRFRRIKTAIDTAAMSARFAIGYRSFPRLMAMFTIEMVQDIFNKWNPVAEGVIDYQMLDYVEWKTGLRSEGMTMAVSGMLNKLIRKNIGTVTGNMWLQWT